MKMNKDRVFRESVKIKYEPRGRYYVFISKSRLRDRIKSLFSGKFTFLYVAEEEFFRQGYICVSEYTYKHWVNLSRKYDEDCFLDAYKTKGD